jgi:hypothetical protein
MPSIATESVRRNEPTQCARTGREQMRQTTYTNGPLFDDLVGAGEQRRRHFEPERIRGLEVEHQLVLGRCLHWKISGLLAL